MALQNGREHVVALLKGKLTRPQHRGNKRGLCIVCMDSGAEVVLVPCGHRNLCGVCARQWSRRNGCPVDRMPVSEILHLKKEE